jgi:hypothetical protein
MMMRSRLLIGAIAAVAGFGFSLDCHAEGRAEGYRAKSHRITRHRHRFYGHHAGGHRFGHQNAPFTFSDSNNYPGHYNNQTFWERVQTQRNYPVQY